MMARVPFTRRSLLQAGLVIPAIAVVDACSSSKPHPAVPSATPSASASASGGPTATSLTTLDQTLLRGPAGTGGFVQLMSGAGEPHLARADLGIAAKSGRENRRSPLLTFSHLTDMHVVDAQSPARVEFLDRYDDAIADGPLIAAYRPHEFLTAHVADTMAATVRSLGPGPVSKQKPSFAISTGDAVDNCQENELRWTIDLLDGGGTLRADSGDLSKWEGVADSDPTYYDPHYWHPDGPPAGKAADNAMTKYGFPRVPGLLDAVRRPFTATGLGISWYAAYGNHDGLIQGNAPLDGAFSKISTGNTKIIGLPASISALSFAANLLAGKPLPAGLPARTVTADPKRKVVSRAETIAAHFTTTGSPVGHGFTTQNRSSGTAYYTFEASDQILGIVLDTVNPGGLSNGSLDPVQFAWLKTQLTAAANKIVVLFSHHTIATMDNGRLATGEKGARILGPEVAKFLLGYPQVVLWVNGHTHVNAVFAHKRPPSQGAGGFWELNTASHIDWPQQSRLVEIMDNKDGTLSVFGTILDFVAPTPDPTKLQTPAQLASLSRLLSANDWQERTGHSATVDGRRGKISDRNVELLVPDPRKNSNPANDV
jgi:metallophosphoesterase (TIGR03767 family)